MAYYNRAKEIYKYLGGVFRAANDTETGPKLKAADIDPQIYYTDPDAAMTVRLREPAIEVVDGADNPDADLKLYMLADIGNKFWRREYNRGVGLAKG